MAASSSASTTEPLFNVAQIKTCTEVEGPRRRMAVWFQGCDIRCPGCCNPGLQPMVPAHLMKESEILGIARRSMEENGIEGVTFMGGEPTLQQGLASLARGLRGIGLGTILFTGRKVEKLPEELIESVDMIVDGPYMMERPERKRNLLGSENQRIIDVSGRYAGDMDWFRGDGKVLRVEYELGDGYLMENGDVVDGGPEGGQHCMEKSGLVHASGDPGRGKRALL